jgi:hypothetical protein
VSTDEKVWVPVDEAISRLAVIEDYDAGNGPEPCVHTFRASMMLLGAHWSVVDARKAFETYGVEESGPSMQSMGHGLAIVDDDGPVFFETRAEKV